jgi:sugar O-acyltransferase (sialic acid O-acetyltransferase NeuD family)
MRERLTVKQPDDFCAFPRSAITEGIHRRFEDIANKHPQNIAVTTDGAGIEYHRANGFANSIAAAILSACGTSLAQVAILLPNSAMTIMCMLGALKARKAYVPLDIHFPKERLRAMLDDSGPIVVLTDTEHLPLAEEMGAGRARIFDVSTVTLDAEAPNPGIPCEPMDRAYILYTSGSTGRPKGIEFPHRNLLHTTMCLTNRLFFAPSDRVTWMHSPTFGSSVVDIYCCLTNGGTLLPWDAKAQGFNGMAAWLIRERATTLQWIPSAFRQFVRTLSPDCVLKDIRIAVMAGEPLTVREVEMFRKHFARGSHLVNQVGTGESYNYYLYCIDHDLAIDGAGVPGGYPVSEEREVLILDDRRQPVAAGEIGEIAIRSDYMAAGYWNDPVQTREKFVQIGGDRRPVYLTGDLGKLGPDGCLTHLGRGDFQIKLRGCRVEVAEIEHLLDTVPGVADSAAWVAKNRAGEEQLVGYVVLKPAAPFDRTATATLLAKQLPDYMVPRHYVVMDELPALPTGKVDRKGLPNPFLDAAPKAAGNAASANPIEREMIEYFEDILEIGNAHRDTDFVGAGGDSLMAAVLAERIFRRYAVTLHFQDFTDSMTPERLAAAIGAILGAERPTKSQGSAPEQSESVQSSEEPRILIPVPMTRPAAWSPGSDGMPERAADSPLPDLVIIGAGQCGREVYTWAAQCISAGAPWRIKGFLDAQPKALDAYCYEAGILGSPADYVIKENDVFVAALGNPITKKKCCSSILRQGGRFINIIHPSANVGKNVRFGTGVVLGPFASVTSDVRIGSHVSVGALSNVAHDVVVGDYCQISSHCGLNGLVEVGEGVFLGSHACVIPKLKVGAWAYIGAGSIVVRCVAPGQKVFGNPAKVIGKVSAG